MPKSDFLTLYAKFSGFRILVRANQLGCDTAFARDVHDRLLAALDRNAASCIEAIRLERLLRGEPDPAMQDALADMIGDCIGDLQSGGMSRYPFHLLDPVDYDPERGGYVHPVFAVWCRGRIPESMAATDRDLCGLRTIIDQIATETGCRFTAYQCDGRGEAALAGERDLIAG